MSIFDTIFFLILGGAIGWLLTYLWVFFRYKDKEKVDKCYKERADLKTENENLKKQVKDLQEEIKKLKKDLEGAYREIAEKNKYLSEDKVIVERLYEVKMLSDKISSILIDYDKETIQHLLKEYQCKMVKTDEQQEEEEKEKKIGW